MIEAMASASNAFACHFDEVRTDSVPEDRMAAFMSVMRSGYDGAFVGRGGAGESKLGIRMNKLMTPLIYSGEEALNDVALAERTVSLSPTKQGQNADAYLELSKAGLIAGAGDFKGLGCDYLHYLLRRIRHQDLGLPPVVTSRVQHAENITRWGYGILVDFLRPYNPGFSYPTFDSSHMTSEAKDVTDQSPYLKLLLQLASSNSRTDGMPLVLVDGEDVLIRLWHMSEAARQNNISLPSTTDRAMKRAWEADPLFFGKVSEEKLHKFSSTTGIRIKGMRSLFSGTQLLEYGKFNSF
jgi:hypothetical protein